MNLRSSFLVSGGKLTYTPLSFYRNQSIKLYTIAVDSLNG